MAIGDQFSGLDMKNLIGAPLGAAADASVQLAHSTADFINSVGFDKDGKTRTASFKFNQKGVNEDGTTDNQEMNVDVPLLAIVPIPNLQIDEVNVLFDMEVKQSEKSESASDYAGSFTGTANFGIVKVTVSGSVSSHSSNTRSSDNSAKYHVDVTAGNHGTPEGLARVLDMMAANVAPTLVASTAVDETGKPLVGERKAKNDKLKALRAKKFQLENAYQAAEKNFDNAMTQMLLEGNNKRNKYSVLLGSLINKDADDEGKVAQYTDVQQKVDGSWSDFQNTAKATVSAVAGGDTTTALTQIFHLLGASETGALLDFSAKSGEGSTSPASPELDALVLKYQGAVESYKTVLACKQQVDANDLAYNNLLVGVIPADAPTPPVGG